MAIAIFPITSSLHSETQHQAGEDIFLKDIEKALGERFVICDDFSSFGTHDIDLIYVRTGGTEGIFRAKSPKGEIRLLTSGESNSLAASMEILAYLRGLGQKGEILHGSAEYIAGRITSARSGSPFASADAPSTPFLQPFAGTDLGGIRLGVIGKPSDWLISSNVDYEKVRKKMGVELIDIPMKELTEEVKKADVDLKSFAGSEAIYDALKLLVGRYNLSGLTLRCFDLLDSVHNTGCLALARLNAEGIVSSCEGDIPALLSMVYAFKKYGQPGFQCNLSKIDGNELLFAHCTVPLSMVKSYQYATHFESGIGTAIKAEMPEGEVEIFKIAPDLERCVVIPGKIVRNESKPNLCRTQIVVKAEGAAGYFLSETLANHHVVIYKQAQRQANLF